MAQPGKRVLARTLTTREFTGTIAQNAAAFASLDVKALSLGENVDALLRAVTIVSMEDLDWELWFFTKTGTAGNSAAPDTNTLIGRVVLPTTALQIAATGLYTFVADALQVQLYDEDRTSKIHMALVNRAAASKTAGAAGAVRVSLSVEPTLGW
jgi:hypothetical protein